MSWTHGTPGLVFAYALSAAGVLAGLLVSRADTSRIIRFPLIAIPALIAASLLWSLLTSAVHLTVAIGPAYYVLAAAFLVMIGALAGRLTAKLPLNSAHQRGTILEQAGPQSTPKWGTASRISFAGQPLQPLDEIKHFKLIGTTGTGKSTAIRELLAGALVRGDRAVIADPDGSFLRVFYDAKRGDVILNPFDSRAARWDLFAEMQRSYDADQLARSLIPDTEGTERNWRGYARIFLTSLLRQLNRVKHDDPAELYQLLSTTPVNDLRELLEDTPAGPYLAQDNGKFFGAVRAVAITHLASLEHVAQQGTGERVSVRSWIRAKHGRGGVLFIPYSANEIATLRSLISTWMRLAIFETMSPRQDEDSLDQRLWFVVDELDAVGPIDGLKDALVRHRKFGGRCVLGFQSIAQVSGTYGRAEAQTIVENCGNTLILRCSASEGGGTARFASGLIGEREIIREQTTMSRRPHEWFASKSVAKQHVIESAILASEIEQLADLHGILKLASQPQWTRVRLANPG